jgi:dTDP-glucose 4,6-dehydratase
MIFVTGGAGFIGSNFVHHWLAQCDESVVNLDKLTYSGNLDYLKSVEHNPRHTFVQGDIADRALVEKLLNQYKPRAVLNFAAETHVDRSIAEPNAFIQTNVVGTFQLLEAVRAYWLASPSKENFRFVQISTDEVYGSLSPQDPPFTEEHVYAPNSPYSASKASADHLVRAWHHTYGLPTLTTHCSNNYGPFQFPEKLIPLVIKHALSNQPLPIYGDGQQVPDWLYEGHFCEAICSILVQGDAGENYNIGGQCEKTNLEVVMAICAALDQQRPRPDGKPYSSQITHVADRLGHDRRYAIDTSKIESELGWRPRESFNKCIQKTVVWYLSS